MRTRGLVRESSPLVRPRGLLLNLVRESSTLVLLLGMIAYNLLRLIGQESLEWNDAPIRNRPFRRRIRSVMQDLIYLACRMVKHSRQLLLSSGRRCPWFNTWQRIYLRLDRCPDCARLPCQSPYRECLPRDERSASHCSAPTISLDRPKGSRARLHLCARADVGKPLAAGAPHERHRSIDATDARATRRYPRVGDGLPAASSRWESSNPDHNHCDVA